jgi:hypothetical protein
MAKKKGGRPTKMTPEILKKLEEVYAIGGSDGEACLWANIDPRTLYYYQEKHPEFIQRKKTLQKTPTLRARQEVVKGLKDNPEFAFKYLTKKKRDEFGDNIDVTSKGEKIQSIQVEIIKPDDPQN